ncbi:hypothetical protein VPH35_097080 [Triticum aestivum]
MDGGVSGGCAAAAARSDDARKWGARQWLNHGTRPPPAFDRRELKDFDRELARRRHASSGNWSAGSSSAGASSSRLVPVKREPEEAVKREPEEAVPDAPPRRGAHASKEADLRVMKSEQAKLYVDLDSDSSDSD